MRALLCLSLLFVLLLAGFAQAPSAVTYQNLPGVQLYSHGYLFSWDSPEYSRVTIYGRNAKPAFSLPERVGTFSFSRWAADTDGVFAKASYSIASPSQGRIDLLDLASNLIGTIHTGSFLPLQVVFAPDHTIWSASQNARDLYGQHHSDVLHHYARNGAELGEALPWSQSGGDPEMPTVIVARGMQLLFAADDRLGFEAGLHKGFPTWMEVSYAGVLLGKYELTSMDGRPLWPQAMTASGQVYAQISRPTSARFAVLDRAAGIWREVEGDPGGILVGSEGNNLVFAQVEGATSTLRFVPAESLQVR